MTPSGTPASRDNVLVMAPAPSGLRPGTSATQRMAGETFTRRAARTGRARTHAITAPGPGRRSHSGSDVNAALSHGWPKRLPRRAPGETQGPFTPPSAGCVLQACWHRCRRAVRPGSRAWRGVADGRRHPVGATWVFTSVARLDEPWIDAYLRGVRLDARWPSPLV
jgi:hypothetical protein